MLAAIRKSLSASKSAPDLATISVGRMIVLPDAGFKKCQISNASIVLVASLGILGPNKDIESLFSFNQFSSLIKALSLSRVSILLP
jgi:hypothetical protein